MSSRGWRQNLRTMLQTTKYDFYQPSRNLEYLNKSNQLGVVGKPRLKRASIYITFLWKKGKWRWKKWRWKFATFYVIKLRSPISHRRNFNPCLLQVFNFSVLYRRNTSLYFTQTLSIVFSLSYNNSRSLHFHKARVVVLLALYNIARVMNWGVGMLQIVQSKRN